MNALEYPERSRMHNRKPRKFLLAWTLLMLVLLSAGFAAFFVWLDRQPNENYVEPDFGGIDKPVYYQGERMQLSAEGSGVALMIPMDIIRDIIDPHIRYEAESDSVIITTADKVVQFRTDQLTAMMNETPFPLHVAAKVQDDIVLVPAAPLERIYPVRFHESKETGIVQIEQKNDMTQWASVVMDSEHPERTTALRTGPSIKEPILADLKQGEEVSVWQELDRGWYYVQLQEGFVGYVHEEHLAFSHIETADIPFEQISYIPWKPIGGKVNLTWEAVYNHRNPDVAKIPAMPGLNVVSPTWFELKQKEGTDELYIQNWADPAYVKWAHERGLQVWALFSNGFDPDRTTIALSTFEQRRLMVNQLIAFAQMYNLQGINIDFENVYLADKDLLTQFMRELAPLAHEQGLVLSIDVTIRGGSPMWSLFYDREALGKIVDYMMVMTYDEHWAASPIAGSVASLSWAEKGIADIMKEDHVPASKLILAIPYYTRLWIEEFKDGKSSMSSRALGMEAANEIVRSKGLTPVFDEKTGQNYVEYKEGTTMYRMWLEDSVSTRARSEIVRKYDLAGIATWRRGFEIQESWTDIVDVLERRP